MVSLKPIPLDDDWRYFPTEDLDPTYGASELDESSWGALARLADAPREVIAFYGTLNLRRRFDLEPMLDQCVRYELHWAAAPEGAQVFINGWQVGVVRAAGQPLVSDVTDFVSLEDNLILIRLGRKKGEFGALWLLPTPCAPA